MLSQAFNRSTAIRRNSFGYRPTRLFATCSAFPCKVCLIRVSQVKGSVQQALLGHSSSEVTRDVYLHSIPADARAAVQKVEDFLNRPKLTQDVEFAKTGSSLIQ